MQFAPLRRMFMQVAACLVVSPPSDGYLVDPSQGFGCPSYHSGWWLSFSDAKDVDSNRSVHQDPRETSTTTSSKAQSSPISKATLLP